MQVEPTITYSRTDGANALGEEAPAAIAKRAGKSTRPGSPGQAASHRDRRASVAGFIYPRKRDRTTFFRSPPHRLFTSSVHPRDVCDYNKNSVRDRRCDEVADALARRGLVLLFGVVIVSDGTLILPFYH